MKIGKRNIAIFQIFCALALLVLMLPSMCTSYIYPDEIGIRQSVFSGVYEEDFFQGRVLDLPLLHTIHRLPRDIQYLQFSGPTALSLRTRENNVIDVDVDMLYRIKAGEGHQIITEGMAASYDDKVKSVGQGFLREHLAQMSNTDVQQPEQRERVAKEAVAPLSERVAQYHVEILFVNIRGIRFKPEYEAKLMQKQRDTVQGKLDRAKEKESEAIQKTDTVEKGIDKDVKLESETWNGKIEEKMTEFETQIARINAEALTYDKAKRADADALCKEADADGEKAEQEAKAYGEELRAKALTTRAGRTYSAIEAAKVFKMGDFRLNSTSPDFLLRFGSAKAWRQFFMPE